MNTNLNKSSKGLLSRLFPLNLSTKTKSLICAVSAFVGGIISGTQGVSADIGKTYINLGNGNQPLITDSKETPTISQYDSKTTFIIYKIKWGDTLTSLSNKYKVSIDELVKLNKIKNRDIIKEGDNLIIPNNIGFNTDNKSKDTKEFKPRILKKKITSSETNNVDEKNIVASNDNIQTNSTLEKVPVFTQEIKEKVFIEDKENFDKLFMYAKLYHKGKLEGIIQSNEPTTTKNKKIMELYFRDEEIFESRITVKKVKEIQIDDGISGKIQGVLNSGGLNVTVHDLLETIMKVESSGGAYLDFIIAAGKTNDINKQNKYINKAINWALGDSNDCGPFNITPDWVTTELENGAKLDGKIERNIHILRIKLRRTFEKAIREKLTEEQIINLLAKIDARFDVNQMSKMILNSFNRIHGNLKAENLNDADAIKGTIMAYNIGEGMVYRHIKRNKGELKRMPRDTDKKLSFMKIASIKNDTLGEKSKIRPLIIESKQEIKEIPQIENQKILQIASNENIPNGLQVNTGNITNNGESINEQNKIPISSKIVQLRDYSKKVVERITSHIEDEELRTSIQKKLGDNPLETVKQNIRIRINGGNTDERKNIRKLVTIGKRIQKITEEEYKKAA